MVGTLFRLLLRLAVAGLILYLARGSLRRWVDGPDPAPDDPHWYRAPERPAAERPAAERPAARQSGAGQSGAGHPAEAEPAGAWVTPATDGSAPESHPVKVKLSSGIYHVPGGANYGRTRPDRCYATADEAERDGFVAAKR